MADNDNPFPDDFSDLDQMAKSGDYKPEASGFLPGPEAVEDGVYDFEIMSVSLKKTIKEKKNIVEMVLRVLSGPRGGIVLQRASHLTTVENMNRLAGDLITLGLDADKWNSNGKNWSVNLAENAPKLVGRRFVGKKVFRSGDKLKGIPDYHNIYINAVITGSTPPGAHSQGFNEFASSPPKSADPIPW